MDRKSKQSVDINKIRKEAEIRRKIKWDEFYSKYNKPFSEDELSLSEDFPEPEEIENLDNIPMAEEDLCIEVSDGSDESGDEGIAEDDDNLKAFVAVFKEQCQQKIEMFEKIREQHCFEETKTDNMQKSRRESIITKERRLIHSPIHPSNCRSISNVLKTADNLDAITGNNNENSLALVQADPSSNILASSDEILPDGMENHSGVTYYSQVTVQTVTKTQIIRVENGEKTPVGTPNKDSSKNSKCGHSTKRKSQASNKIFNDDDDFNSDFENVDFISPPKAHRFSSSMRNSWHSSPSQFSSPGPQNAKNSSNCKEIVLSTPKQTIGAKNHRMQQVMISGKETQKIVRSLMPNAGFDTKSLSKRNIRANEDEKVCLEISHGTIPSDDVDDDLLAIQDKQTVTVVKHVYT